MEGRWGGGDAVTYHAIHHATAQKPTKSLPISPPCELNVIRNDPASLTPVAQAALLYEIGGRKLK